MGKMKVIVSPWLTVGYNESLDLHTARFRELGLTAYGRTQDDAFSELCNLLDRFLHHASKTGSLKEQLDHTGVDWSQEPVDDEEEAGLTVKHLDCPTAPTQWAESQHRVRQERMVALP